MAVMKQKLSLVVLSLFAVASLFAQAPMQTPVKIDGTGGARTAKQTRPPDNRRPRGTAVGLLGWRAGIRSDAFGALPSKIPGIASYKWGRNVSPEKHDKGFTHCFILGFKTEKDRDDYLVHPDHKAFGKTLGPVLGAVFVIDFWAQGGTGGAK